MTVKENFLKLIHEKGFKNLSQFCLASDIDTSNMNKRLIGVKQKIEISFAFKLANILRVDISEIIKIFYPDEYKENQELIGKDVSAMQSTKTIILNETEAAKLNDLCNQYNTTGSELIAALMNMVESENIDLYEWL